MPGPFPNKEESSRASTLTLSEADSRQASLAVRWHDDLSRQLPLPRIVSSHEPSRDITRLRKYCPYNALGPNG
eukprot:6205104-Amphidinium_carterae.1